MKKKRENKKIKVCFSIQVVIIKKGSRLKGFGFVGFKSLNEAEKAVKNLDKTELDGRDISVQLAKPRQEPIVEKKKKKRRPAKKSRQQQSSVVSFFVYRHSFLL
jgi:RNA recognition motif-containing protein